MNDLSILFITATTKKFWAWLGLVFISLIQTKKGRRWLLLPFGILLLGFLLPNKSVIPVEGANTSSWNKASFWAYPWGTSVTHKGIDIFQQKGKKVLSSTYGIIVYRHEGGKGGKSVMVLGPKWRFHYYAHLDEFQSSPFQIVKPGTTIGTVGDSGNAKGKAPHLHYSIVSPFPYLWLRDAKSVQGWKKMFYLDPGRFLE